MSKRILLVDDDNDIREVASVSLEAIGGYTVSKASSGQEALERAAAERPDAVLLDVMMPDMDGPTTFARLQGDEATRAIPVILLTAKVQASDRRQLDELAVAAVLAKPFDPLELPGQVARALGWG